MKEYKKIYWKGFDQLTNELEYIKGAQREFAPPPAEDPGHSRRDFLRMMGFGVAAASLAACEAPVRYAIPYVTKPMDVDPSVPNYYASTYMNGGDYCSIVVKTREGRPIKVDGNSLSTVSMGGTSSQVQASVLSLYDNARLRGPKKGKERITWEDLDREIIAKLDELAAKNARVRLVSNTVLSPSTRMAIGTLTTKYPNVQHIMYDPVSHFGMWKANEESFGVAMIPSYDFSKAEVVVSVAADFLCSWLAPIEFSAQFAKTRQVSADKRDMSRHYQFESIMSVTGANADYRTPIKPSQHGAVVIALYNLLATKAGRPTLPGGVQDVAHLSQAAEDLWASRGKALVVAGSNDKAVQVLVNGINDMLGNYGTTILPSLPVNYRQGDDVAIVRCIEELHNGTVEGIIFFNCNPVYDHPMGDKLAAGVKKAPLSVATSLVEDETASLVQYKAPDHHFLEAWNDAEPKKNRFSLSQPTITPIFKSRSAQEGFLSWAGQPNVDYYEYVRNNWLTWFYNDTSISQEQFFDRCLYEGVLERPVEDVAVTFAGDVNAAAGTIAQHYRSSGFELVVYDNGVVGNGSDANNPLLQELPDPITRIVWDHWVSISIKDANGLKTPESKTFFANITANGKTVSLPVLIQPGQAPGTVGIPLGYGRTNAGKVANGLGKNVYPLLNLVNGSLAYQALNVQFQITEEPYQLAQVQTQDTYMGRQTIIQETNLSSFKTDPKSGGFYPEIHTWAGEEHTVDPEKLSMWKGHLYKDHHWGMSIDLNSCTGCGACVVACNVENNVALVGREEVINRREMHWLRIDRYYSSGAETDDWKELEFAAENPEVVFQPMLCQHCNNAPCETVCPVAATTHSTEGLNQMTYNRCIGTRYCANNCPYKVRRFNWFKYHDNSQFENVNPQQNTMLGKMVLNPDVTVRSRGVMEKCSFCVQRIQAGKLKAKHERRTMKDEDVTTACAAACTTGAIVFGDMNDPESKVSKLLEIRPLYADQPHINDKEAGNPRAYCVLEELNVRPNIFYLRKVRNRAEADA